MIKFDITNPRTLFKNDLRVLQQFLARNPYLTRSREDREDKNEKLRAFA
ncbi:MAG TPA: hypothetical protein VHX14_05835 [Thermoanaerobaculia bacterium]|jgi:hypothetical protein|nr:hypothetical protein [Thermoanaerobaculia bacterium]